LRGGEVDRARERFISMTMRVLGGRVSIPDRTSDFVRLLRQHEREVYAFILCLLPNWSDADDVWQETTVRLWEEFDKFREGSDFAAWARTVARYQVLSYRKRRSRRREQFDEAFIDTVAERSDAEAATGASELRSAALAKCLKKLPEHNRALLSAYYASGAVVRDVAVRVGRTAESLKVTVFRIRRALHQCIEREQRNQL
jgi:RNA polymerase sigma-70 factor (ECF subfamily)